MREAEAGGAFLFRGVRYESVDIQRVMEMMVLELGINEEDD